MHIMREPILEYLKNNVPEVAWTASRSSITGEVVVDGYPEGCFICISLQAVGNNSRGHHSSSEPGTRL